MRNFWKKGIIIATIAGTIFSGSVLAAGKNEYIKMEEKSIKKAIGEVEDVFKSDIAKILLPIAEKARKESTVNFELDIEGDQTHKLNSQTIMDYDTNKEYLYIDFKSQFNDENLISLNGSIEKDKFLLIIPELMNQYLYLDASKLGEADSEVATLFETLKSTLIQEESTKMAKALEFTDSEMKILKKSVLNYYNVLKKSLPESAFTIQKNTNIEYNNKAVTCNMVEMALTGEDIEKIIIDLLNAVKKDEKLLNLIFTKFDKIIDSYDEETKRLYGEWYTKEALVEYIDSYIEELNSDEPIKDNQFIVRNYFDKNNNVLQREFVDPYTGGAYFTLTTVPNEYYGVKYFETRYEYEDEYIYDEEWDYYYPSWTRKEIREEIDLHIEIIEDKDKKEFLINLGNLVDGPEIILTLDKKNKILVGETMVEGVSISFESKLDNKTSKKSIESNFKINSEEVNLMGYIKDSVQENVKLNKINAKNKVDVSSYSDEDFINLLQPMSEKAVELGLDDEEKAIAILMSAMTSLPEVRTLGFPVTVTVANWVTSFAVPMDGMKDDIIYMNESDYIYDIVPEDDNYYGYDY